MSDAGALESLPDRWRRWASSRETTDEDLRKALRHAADALAAERERTRQLEEALLRKRDALRYIARASFDTQSDAEICDLMRGVARAALDSAEADTDGGEA